MKTFLIDREKEYSYHTLLADINRATVYYPLCNPGSLYHYLLNILIALVSHKPLVLDDSDSSSGQMPVPVDPLHFNTIDEVTAVVQCSTSQVTIFTSGTTGQPKKVIHTIATLGRAVRTGPVYHDQVWAFAYNPTHMAGLQVFFQAILNINTLVNVFNAPRQYVYRAIEEHHITHISATPTFYRLLLPVESAFPAVRRVTLGGERSDQKLYDFILRIFPQAKITNIYASTEAGTLFAASGDAFQIPAGILNRVKIEDDELLIHKSLLGQSSQFAFCGDYYHTGDIVEWVNKEQGLFRINSRKNELINVGGYKVNPLDVETAILQLPDILQAVVYGQQNSVLGNILCAEVKLMANSALTELDIRVGLARKLQDFKIPRKIKFVDSITLTRTGKIKRV
ncbi:fatty acid--CoA ligase family protein [uncultured Bacteroides sp.]|uniref:ANL family adenylate-forming protein n=1 Tax=uncultured Bacteroides sp. TaxID=162156 RepID=UPI002AA8ED1A|nr:fatty acid--CoA ligase family protein [uncultured Bacteroides sp.]